MIEVLERHRSSLPALLDPEHGVEVSYGELVDRVGLLAGRLARDLGRGLVLLVATNTVESIVSYLACLEASCPVCLLEHGPAARLAPLLEAYQPDAVFHPRSGEPFEGLGSQLEVEKGGLYRLTVTGSESSPRSLHPQLALLLTTSGSTGSPKLARLTRANVVANATSIARYLTIESGERALQSLPMHYSYGLSVINSHLIAGATIVLSSHSFMRPEFWGTFDRAACTSIAGVPYVYETLHRLRFDPSRHPTLRTMTQAGGALRPDLIRAFHERATAAECRFFVMYGQTEATARIAYVPFDRLAGKIGSIGIAIPEGTLSLAPVDDAESAVGAELVYTGPNVMMGYAESAADLAIGDTLGGVLHTGDLATRDADGFHFLTGRLKRLAKLFGRRVNLEDVERDVEQRYPVAAAVVEHNEAGGLRIYAAPREPLDLEEVGRYLAAHLGVPPRYIMMSAIDFIPRTASGKKDYRALPG